ncbi:hypothetical protein [Streptomyces malaysiensis]|uniref:hypothetical protein n=1 Tax=Streptomyces malaysiensis TaxID=92644 RepID=UPI0008538F20|nr:hypothetical protein [Streptomyces sp. SPMA113]
MELAQPAAIGGLQHVVRVHRLAWWDTQQIGQSKRRVRARGHGFLCALPADAVALDVSAVLVAR